MGHLSTLTGLSIADRIKDIVQEINDLPDDEAIAVINAVKLALHEVSPMKDEPVDCVLWVKADTIQANDYNPNVVAPPEMKLLAHSISADGYTQPIVTFDTRSRTCLFSLPTRLR